MMRLSQILFAVAIGLGAGGCQRFQPVGAAISSSSVDSLQLSVPAPAASAQYQTYASATALTNDAMAGWPASNAIVQNPSASYSSNPFATAVNDRETYLEVDLLATQPVNEIVLTARMLNGQPMAFPTRYQIEYASSSASGWQLIGDLQIQPDPNGLLMIALSQTYQILRLRISPEQLGADEFGVHYFQMANVVMGFAASSPSTGLICWVPGISASLPTATQTLAGSAVQSTIGITAQLGGIGTNFVLTANGESLEILTPRSVGGAGLSTTFYSIDAATNHAYSFNQGAGNMEQMWGYYAQLSGLVQTNWVPLYSDHWQPNGDYNAAQTNTSPCDPATNPIVNDEGQMALTGKLLTPSTSVTTAHWEYKYSYRSLRQQSFAAVNADQALYLDRAAGRSHGLRVYFVGENRAWTEEVNPLDMSDAFNTVDGQQAGGCGDVNCTLHTGNLNYAVLVYKVGGADVGVAIHRTDGKSMQAQLNLETASGCVGNDECGNVNFHSWLDDDAFNPPAATFTAGQVRSYSISYEVGSLSDLAALGFVVP